MIGRKWVVIGLDGVSFNVLRPLAERGLIPNLATLMREGATADLASTIPWQTPVAWASYATGVNPGSHGVYGWWQPDTLAGLLRPTNGGIIQAARFWEILSAVGVEVGIVNVPMSYPARPVHGFSIVGMDSPWHAPETDPLAYYPRDLPRRLDEAGIDYRIHPKLTEEDDPIVSAAQWIDVEEARLDAVAAILQNFHPRFLQLNLFATDYIAHRTSPGDPAFDAVFAATDAIVGRLIEGAGPEANILVISDHGSCRIDRLIMIHNLLQDIGVLSFKPWLADEQVARILGPSATSSEIKALLAELWRRGPSARAAIYRDVAKQHPGANIGFTTIDWDSTTAYCTSDYGQVRLNRERGEGAISDNGQGTLETVRQALLMLNDHASPGPIVAEVLSRELIYKGPYAAAAPDLTPIVADHSYYFCQAYSYYNQGERRSIAPVEEVVDPVRNGCLGDHLPFGVLIAAGPDIVARGTLSPASILDCAPTILHCFDVAPLPEHEGAILGDLFGKDRILRESDPRILSLTLSPGLRERLMAIGYRI